MIKWRISNYDRSHKFRWRMDILYAYEQIDNDRFRGVRIQAELSLLEYGNGWIPGRI